jgi:uncharacterized protein
MTHQDPDVLPYARWVGDALRGVVRRALEHTSRHGLIGEHHFYVSFRTTDAGVHIPDHLRARYPSEMTIVLQHQFWDLEVGTDAFTVSLRFGGRLTPLRIPFAAVTAFGDPSVSFGLQFAAPAGDGEGDREEEVAQPPDAASAGSPAEEAPATEKGAGGRVIAFDTFRKK